MEKFSIADNQQGQALSYIVGVYFGDGCVTNRKFNKDDSENRCFALQTIDKDFRDYTVEQFGLAFPEGRAYPHDHNRTGKGMVYSMRGERVGQMIEAMTGKRTLIPNFVYASRGNTMAFLEGLLDSEGWVTDTTYLKKNEIACVIGFAITSELAHEFKRMLESLGVKVGKIHTKKLPSGKVAKQMHFNVASFLESGLTFHCWRKQRKVEAHRWARKVLEEVLAMKKSPFPDGVSFNDYKQRARQEILKKLRAIV